MTISSIKRFAYNFAVRKYGDNKVVPASTRERYDDDEHRERVSDEGWRNFGLQETNAQLDVYLPGIELAAATFVCPSHEYSQTYVRRPPAICCLVSWSRRCHLLHLQVVDSVLCRRAFCVRFCGAAGIDGVQCRRPDGPGLSTEDQTQKLIQLTLWPFSAGPPDFSTHISPQPVNAY